MIAALKRIFSSEPKAPPKLPEVGEHWCLGSNDGSPWPLAQKPPILITGVQDGWVRYDISPNMFRDQRLEMDSFLHIYRYIEPEQD